MANSARMNIQGYLEDAYRIIKAEPVILILGGFIVQLLTILTMGILAGPISGGYFLLIIHYLRDNRKPSFNDIFSGLQRFGSLFPFVLVLIIILIGFMLLLLPGFLFATWWLYVLPLMVDRKVSYSEAMRLSMNKVNETGFLMHLVFFLLITVIPMALLNFLSAIIPVLFVLKILLPPFQAACLASLYIDQFGKPEQTAPSSPESGSTPAAAPEDNLPVKAGEEIPAAQNGHPERQPEEPDERSSHEDENTDADPDDKQKASDEYGADKP